MAKLEINSTAKMLSGYEIPRLGFGVYQTPAAECEKAVLKAFESGYRHVDSARFYHNEAACANAIRNSGLSRSDIFFTSKVPPPAISYDGAKSSIEATFKETGLDYIDLYLLHAPYGGKEGRLGAWKALVEAKKAGKIRSIGVSNYGVHHLDELAEYIKSVDAKEGKGAGGTIDVGQWELHPWLCRPDIVSWCEKNGTVIEAYCPIVRGQRFDEPSVQKLVKKYGKTPAEILIRFSLQKGWVPLPKSVTPKRIEENAIVYDFELSKEDMADLETKDYSPCAWDPTTNKD